MSENIAIQQIELLTEKFLPQLLLFCDKCDKLGYKNNNSLKAMKYHWCIENGGAWWVVLDNNNIVSVSGMHPFKDGWRVLFRGCQIGHRDVPKDNGWHLTSHPFASILPYQLQYTDNQNIYITTNIDHDASGKMSHAHRELKNLCDRGIVNFIGDEEIFHTKQSIWKVNIDRYNHLIENYEEYISK